MRWLSFVGASAVLVGAPILARADTERVETSAQPPTTLRVAQVDSPRSYTTGTDARLQLDEVVVTARRQEENAQTVPVAITVVSQETLTANNIQSIGDLQNFIPSMTSGTRLTRDSLSLSFRGQGTSSLAGQPGVVVYLNEVPLPTNYQGEVSGGPGLLFDLENVQALKGPQGTLFGRNTMGGALLLQTARPKNEFGGRIQLGSGNYDNREIDAAINFPLVDEKLLVRVAATGQKRDGFTRVLGTPSHPNGVNADDREVWAVRGSIAFRPTDHFQNDTIVTYSEYDSEGAPYRLEAIDPTHVVNVLFPSLPQLFAQQQALGIRTVLPINTDLEAEGHVLSINNLTTLELSDTLTFRNIFGYSVAEQSFARDTDSTVNPILEIPSTPAKQAYKQYTEEAQLLGKSFERRLDWILGVFYLDQPLTDEFVTQTFSLFGGRSDRDQRLGEKSKAIFAQGTYDLSSLVEGLKFTGGLRYTEDERKASRRGGGFPAICVAPTLNCTTITNQKSESSAVTWTAGFDYQATPDTLLYITSRRGYRAGGSNTGDFPQFDPEYVQDVEVGIKSDWYVGDIPIRTNAAVYYENYDDVQVQQNLFIGGAPQVITANAAAARLWGVEFESMVRLTDDLQLGASFDYLNFRYTELGDGVDTVQLLGTELSDRPRWKYALNGRYRLPIPTQFGELSIQANWHWQSRTNINFTDRPKGDPYNDISAYGLLNLAASWDRIGGSFFDVSVFGSNVTNKTQVSSGANLLTNVGYYFTQYIEPRMYGLRVRYRFGAE